MTSRVLSTKTMRPVLYILAFACLMGCAFLAMPIISSWGVLIIGACLGLGALVLAGLYVPELFLAVLLVGMPIWGMLPKAVGERFGGLWIPLTLALAVGCFGLHAALRGRLRLSIPRPVWEDVWLILFTGWLGLAISWSGAPSYGTFKFLGFAANVLCAYLLVRWATIARLFSLQRMARLLIIASLVHIAVVISIDIRIGYWGIGGAAVDTLRTRLLGRMGLNKIAESTAIALGILATSWLWLGKQRKRRWSRIGLPALLLFQIWGLLNYQQRGPMVGLGMATVLLFMFSKRRIWQTFRKGRLGTLLVIALVVLGAVGLAFYILNPSFHVSEMSGDTNVSARFSFYTLGWETFKSNPLRGVGTGGMGIEVEAGYSRFYVHNLILEIMAELGLIGLGLFLPFCGATAIRLYRAVMRLDAQAIQAIALPAAMFLYSCGLAMFSGDLSGWQAGIWVAIIVGIYRVRARDTLRNTVSPDLSVLSQDSMDG